MTSSQKADDTASTVHIPARVRAVVIDSASVLGLAWLCSRYLHVLWFPVSGSDVLAVAGFAACCLGTFKAIGDVLGISVVKDFRASHGTAARAASALIGPLMIGLLCLSLVLGMAVLLMLPSRWGRPPYALDRWVVALILSTGFWVITFWRLSKRRHRKEPDDDE